MSHELNLRSNTLRLGMTMIRRALEEATIENEQLKVEALQHVDQVTDVCLQLEKNNADLLARIEGVGPGEG